MSDELTALDFLAASDRSFAVYRIPGHPPVLVLQQDGLPESLDSLTHLNGRSGFVMAPFQIHSAHPVVLIRPDLRFHGSHQINKYLKIIERLHPRQAKMDFTSSRSDQGYEVYKGAFELFQKALHAGSCDKIVLSRTMQLPLPTSFSAGTLFGTASSTYPDAFVYLCHTPLTGTWFGCTPELLLSGEKGYWQTVALAGTRRIKDSNDVWDSKNIREQQVVTAYLEKQLRIKNLIGSISEPYTVRAGQLMHIKTDFRFQMTPQDKMGDLLDFLHPTPAVCGYPKTEACRLILAHEGYDRSYYSGFVGPLDPTDKSDLYVNLRCASMSEDGLILYAGGGLMPDSELDSEWEETEVKLQTLLSLIQH